MLAPAVMLGEGVVGTVRSERPYKGAYLANGTNRVGQGGNDTHGTKHEFAASHAGLQRFDS